MVEELEKCRLSNLTVDEFKSLSKDSVLLIIYTDEFDCSIKKCIHHGIKIYLDKTYKEYYLYNKCLNGVIREDCLKHYDNAFICPNDKIANKIFDDCLKESQERLKKEIEERINAINKRINGLKKITENLTNNLSNVFPIETIVDDYYWTYHGLYDDID